MKIADIRAVRDTAVAVLDACCDVVLAFELLQWQSPFADGGDGVGTWKYARREIARSLRNLASLSHFVDRINADLDAGVREELEVARIAEGIVEPPPLGSSLSVNWAHKAFSICVVAIHVGMEKAMPTLSREEDPPLTEEYWLKMAERIEAEEGAAIFNRIVAECSHSLSVRGAEGWAEQWRAAQADVRKEAAAAISHANQRDEDEDAEAGVSLRDAAIHVEEGDEAAAGERVAAWAKERKYQSPIPIGKDPDDGRARLYRTNEVVRFLTEIYGYHKSETEALRRYLKSKERQPRKGR